jgi:type III restriction enzyme
MKFKFDANQDFQLEAIKAITDIFEGQEKDSASKMVPGNGLLGIYPNHLNLQSEEVFANVRKIQERNNIETKVHQGGGIGVGSIGTEMIGVGGQSAPSMDFSIEMETGTGKTYVYLRTIFELNKLYGWKKFIILVPSVAIREGVIQTLKVTKEHIAKLYDNVPYRFYEYRSKDISQVKHFADSNHINVMVMTVGAFNKDANVLYSARDQMQGEQPISYIQKANPILILDEPQNMEGEATQEKLKQFNSLFRLRYSATHRTPHNLMYQLTPYDAYQLGLVKKIEVYSVTDDDTGISKPYLQLVSIEPGKSLKAKVEVISKDREGNPKKKKLSLKQGDDLAVKAGNEIYSGYVVDSLDADAPDFGVVGMVRFRNNVEIKKGEGIGGNREELMREQIEQTIRLHFEKRAKLRDIGVKVLSLFFIDKVANYVEEEGFIRDVFVKGFDRIKSEFGLAELDTKAVHKGYFAKKGNEYLERESSIAENQEAYELIMRDKERLLSFDEPTEFIFSHSALKEGWDNPNIFNICTLRATITAVRKRQEIGRGMRLCVNQDGERIFLPHINLLSVIANESYAEYVSQLQSEFVEDGIYKASPIPSNAKRRVTVKLKKDFEKDENFNAIWERISKKTKYLVRVNTEQLIEKCAAGIKALSIAKPQIRIERIGVDVSKEGVSGRVIGNRADNLSQVKRAVDCVEMIKNETKLTRQTVVSILEKAGNAIAFLNNPEKFCFEASQVIKGELAKNYVEQIQYELIPETYSVKQFENIPSHKESVHKVSNSIYDAIVYDSEVEKTFAIDLDGDERIKLFIKLPNWFKVDTPVGGYNPDWAIVTTKRDLQGNDSAEKVYFVIETKGDITNLRPLEQAKINSAKKHFEVIDVNYREVENYNQFVQVTENAR